MVLNKKLIPALLLISIVLLSGCSSNNAARSPTPEASKSADFYSCAEDSDCISVPADFCGCNQGGKATSINKNMETSRKGSLSEAGKGKACIQVISTDPSCSQEPRCVDNKCALAYSDPNK